MPVYLAVNTQTLIGIGVFFVLGVIGCLAIALSKW